MILGASIGGGVLVLLSLLAGMFIYRRRRRDREALEARGSVLQDKIASGQGLGIPGQGGYYVVWREGKGSDDHRTNVSKACLMTHH